MKLHIIHVNGDNYLCHQHPKIGDLCYRVFKNSIQEVVITHNSDQVGFWLCYNNTIGRGGWYTEKHLTYKPLCKIPKNFLILSNQMSFEASDIIEFIKRQKK